MSWITGITIDNYRAFANPETITIPKGQHLLIYGENGSGKSSIYNALNDFFGSSFSSSSIAFNLNEFEKDKSRANGAVTLKIAAKDASGNPIENDYTFAEPISSSTHQISQIQLADKIKGFLDYRKLLKVHSLDISPDKQPNVFNLIVKELLGEHRVSNPRGGATTVALLEKYNQLATILCNKPRHYKIYQAAEQELSKLDASVLALLRQVIDKTNHFLNEYFKNKITLDISYKNLGIFKPHRLQKRQMVEELYLKVKYAGKEIDHYQVFLNEARLSALAVCLYLASIKTSPYLASDLRLLFLDDVFIGLDTSNRLPLLKIIHDEFISHGFQVFISTYDRQWFELAHQWFDASRCIFKCVELFTENDGDPNKPEHPIMLPSQGYLEKAEAYFKAKDYPATGNYLRKEMESNIKNLLPETYKITSNGEAITELEGLIQKLVQLYIDCNIAKPHELIDSLKICRKALLNPTSHDDLKSPLYRSEIEDAFKIIANLKTLEKIDRCLVLNAGQKLSINFPDDAYSMELELCDNMFSTRCSSTKSLSSAKYWIKRWTHKGIDFGTTTDGKVSAMPEGKINNTIKQERTLEEIFRGINKSTGITIPPDLYEVVKIGDSGTLKDLIA